MNPDVNPALVPASTFDSQDIEVGIWFRNFASLFQFVFLGAGDESAAAAATRAIKGGESVIELEAAAAAEIERGRGRRRRGGRGTIPLSKKPRRVVSSCS